MTITQKEIEKFWDDKLGAFPEHSRNLLLSQTAFYYILKLFLRDFNKKDFEKYLDILFIGPREEEINDVKSFLKEKKISRKFCLFTGVDIGGMLTTKGLDFCYDNKMKGLGGKNEGDASAIENFRIWRALTRKEENHGYDLIIIRRINPGREIVDVVCNSLQNLSKNGLVIVTSQQEHRQIKAICEEAAKAPYVDVKYSGNSGLERYEYPFEHYIFVAGKK